MSETAKIKELNILLAQKEQQIESLQNKLIEARDCADCADCTIQCKNNSKR